jgi:hypothetical protein
LATVAGAKAAASFSTGSMYTLPWPATGCARTGCERTERLGGQVACELGDAQLGMCIARIATAADSRNIR